METPNKTYCTVVFRCHHVGMRSASLVLLLAACGACAGAEMIADDVEHIAPEPEPETHPGLTLAPEAGIADLTAAAAAAWSEALGAPVTIGDEGVLVLITPESEMWTPCVVDGKEYSCLPSGKFEDGIIRIRDTANCPLRTLAHEIGHALAKNPHAHAPAPSLMQANPDRGCNWDGVVDPSAVAVTLSGE
jgi:hypothetical protein